MEHPLTLSQFLKTYIPSEYQIGMYLAGRKTLNIENPISLEEIEKALRFSPNTLKKYRNLLIVISEDYWMERENNSIDGVEIPTPYFQYCWEIVHRTKRLLLDAHFPHKAIENHLRTLLKSQSHIFTREAYHEYAQHCNAKRINDITEL